MHLALLIAWGQENFSHEYVPVSALLQSFFCAHKVCYELFLGRSCPAPPCSVCSSWSDSIPTSPCSVCTFCADSISSTPSTACSFYAPSVSPTPSATSSL